MKSRHSIVIIGAGFAGIGLALRLKHAGINDFLIVEKAAGVGGTWWVNRYPGCACDVQSHLYSLSFAPNPNWSRQFPSRSEIQHHLEKVVQEHRLSDHIRFDTEIAKANWNTHLQQWELQTTDNEKMEATILIGAMGGLAKPATPNIPGLGNFQGPIIHSQLWPEDLKLAGKKVAVIGTGASAVQFIPHIASSASELSVFQRTPNWILPKPDRPIPAFWQRAYKAFPLLRYANRFALFVLLETRLPAFTKWPSLSYFHRRKALRHLAAQVTDPSLIKRLTPTYQMGCKRVLMSNDYYPTFNRPNVHLVTTAVEKITSNAIIDLEGKAHTADVLILGTGFEATAPIPANMITGRDGLDLAESWKDGPSAYKGTAVHGFPNFFMLLGPNTALGHNSVLLMIEGQIQYIKDCIATMRKKNWAEVEVTDKAQHRWNAFLDRTLNGAVWNQGGCQSWYLHPRSGRNTTLWPHTTIRFKQLTKRFDVGAYRCK